MFGKKLSAWRDARYGKYGIEPELEGTVEEDFRVSLWQQLLLFLGKSIFIERRVVNPTSKAELEFFLFKHGKHIAFNHPTGYAESLACPKCRHSSA